MLTSFFNYVHIFLGDNHCQYVSGTLSVWTKTQTNFRFLCVCLGWTFRNQIRIHETLKAPSEVDSLDGRWWNNEQMSVETPDNLFYQFTIQYLTIKSYKNKHGQIWHFHKIHLMKLINSNIWYEPDPDFVFVYLEPRNPPRRGIKCFCLFMSIWMLDPDLCHWGRLMHLCVSKLTIIGSDNGLSPGRRQAIIWTNAGILLIGLQCNVNKKWYILIQENVFQNVVKKLAAILSQPQCVKIQILCWFNQTGSKCICYLITQNMES